MKRLQIDLALLAALRAMTPTTVDVGNHGLAKNIQRNMSESTLQACRDELAAENHWSGNMAAVIRKNPPVGQVPVSLLRNEDVIAVLHGIGSGIDPTVAVELAYKDLLVFADLGVAARTNPDPAAYRLIATVTEKTDDEASLALFARADAITYQTEWGADECALLHDHAVRGDMVPMPREFWIRYMAFFGMKYDHSSDVFLHLISCAGQCCTREAP